MQLERPVELTCLLHIGRCLLFSFFNLFSLINYGEQTS